jgi:predicted aspartyl protease
LSAGGFRAPVLGSHVFRFGGHGDSEGVGLPLIPIRLAAGGRAPSPSFNAIVDTGSTHTVLPQALFEVAGGAPSGDRKELKTGGGPVGGFQAAVDLQIVDSHLPSVVCWAFQEARVFVAAEDADFQLPVLGWDLLDHFEIKINRKLGFIELKSLRE